jgi:hypothetical protein
MAPSEHPDRPGNIRAMSQPAPAPSRWPDQPIILEVNTFVWLAELSASLGRPVDLATVPADTWDALVAPGVDAVWLMGVWERSPRGAAIARRHPGVAVEHRRALADFTGDDVVGSPYCVRSYTVDRHLGGDHALAVARSELGRRGARLVLDYVPNHVAHDHPWVTQWPGLFVHGTPQEAAERPREFIRRRGQVVALGRDPYFEPWQDVCQLNAFAGALRRQTAQTLTEIAQRADGVRCDMAMLMTNDVFARTWGERVGPPPAQEFWPPIITQLRQARPDFLFIAEVYWAMEATLLEQGFDYCYDKTLHDQLVAGDIGGLRAHLGADAGHQQHLVRFIENHDEPRAAAALDERLWRAAAVAVLTLPGAALLYEGQFDGRTVRPPVALGRRPPETTDEALRSFYRDLLTFVDDTRLRQGEWDLLQIHGWPDNASNEALLAWSWSAPDARHLVVVNLSSAAAQGRVALPWHLKGGTVVLHDPLQDERLIRSGDALADDGLHVELRSGGWHLLSVTKDPMPVR